MTALREVQVPRCDGRQMGSPAARCCAGGAGKATTPCPIENGDGVVMVASDEFRVCDANLSKGGVNACLIHGMSDTRLGDALDATDENILSSCLCGSENGHQSQADTCRVVDADATPDTFCQPGGTLKYTVGGSVDVGESVTEIVGYKPLPKEVDIPTTEHFSRVGSGEASVDRLPPSRKAGSVLDENAKRYDHEVRTVPSRPDVSTCEDVERHDLDDSESKRPPREIDDIIEREPNGDGREEVSIHPLPRSTETVSALGHKEELCDFEAPPMSSKPVVSASPDAEQYDSHSGERKRQSREVDDIDATGPDSQARASEEASLDPALLMTKPGSAINDKVGGCESEMRTVPSKRVLSTYMETEQSHSGGSESKRQRRGIDEITEKEIGRDDQVSEEAPGDPLLLLTKAGLALEHNMERCDSQAPLVPSKPDVSASVDAEQYDLDSGEGKGLPREINEIVKTELDNDVQAREEASVDPPSPSAKAGSALDENAGRCDSDVPPVEQNASDGNQNKRLPKGTDDIVETKLSSSGQVDEEVSVDPILLATEQDSLLSDKEERCDSEARTVSSNPVVTIYVEAEQNDLDDSESKRAPRKSDGIVGAELDGDDQVSKDTSADPLPFSTELSSALDDGAELCDSEVRIVPSKPVVSTCEDAERHESDSCQPRKAGESIETEHHRNDQVREEDSVDPPYLPTKLDVALDDSEERFDDVVRLRNESTPESCVKDEIAESVISDPSLLTEGLEAGTRSQNQLNTRIEKSILNPFQDVFRSRVEVKGRSEQIMLYRCTESDDNVGMQGSSVVQHTLADRDTPSMTLRHSAVSEPVIMYSHSTPSLKSPDFCASASNLDNVATPGRALSDLARHNFGPGRAKQAVIPKLDEQENVDDVSESPTYLGEQDTASLSKSLYPKTPDTSPSRYATNCNSKEHLNKTNKSSESENNGVTDMTEVDADRGEVSMDSSSASLCRLEPQPAKPAIAHSTPAFGSVDSVCSSSDLERIEKDEGITPSRHEMKRTYSSSADTVIEEDIETLTTVSIQYTAFSDTTSEVSHPTSSCLFTSSDEFEVQHCQSVAILPDTFGNERDPLSASSADAELAWREDDSFPTPHSFIKRMYSSSDESDSHSSPDFEANSETSDSMPEALANNQWEAYVSECRRCSSTLEARELERLSRSGRIPHTGFTSSESMKSTYSIPIGDIEITPLMANHSPRPQRRNSEGRARRGIKSAFVKKATRILNFVLGNKSRSRDNRQESGAKMKRRSLSSLFRGRSS